jgi:hypothetical protein
MALEKEQRQSLTANDWQRRTTFDHGTLFEGLMGAHCAGTVDVTSIVMVQAGSNNMQGAEIMIAEGGISGTRPSPVMEFGTSI